MSTVKWGVLLLCCFLVACGHDGSLYLPETKATDNSNSTEVSAQSSDQAVSQKS